MQLDTSYRRFLINLKNQLPNNKDTRENIVDHLRRHICVHITTLLQERSEFLIDIQKILRIPGEIIPLNGKDIFINHPERLLSVKTQEGREYFLGQMSPEEKRRILLEISPSISGYTYTKKWITNFMIIFEECGIIRNEDWEILTPVLRNSDPVELKKRISLLKKSGIRTAKDFIQSRGFLLCPKGNKRDLEEIVFGVSSEYREALRITCDVHHVESLPRLGCCPDHIAPHMDVLIGDGRATYIRIERDEIIGHIKHHTQKTFLAYSDVYNPSGNHVIKKGHLYTFYHGDKIVSRGEGIYDVSGTVQVRELKRADIGERDLLMGKYCLRKKMNKLARLS